MTDEQYKKLSIDEFTKAAAKYEGNHAGIYEMCKKDYPEILEELEQEPFQDLLDAGCRTGSDDLAAGRKVSGSSLHRT